MNKSTNQFNAMSMNLTNTGTSFKGLTMKHTITLKQSGSFCQNPRFAELEGENVICNDVMLPANFDAASRYNPHNLRLWVIGHEFGAICAVFASGEQDAFDAAVDANKLDCLLAENQNYDDDTLTPLGNASELFDLTHAWIGEVEFDAIRDIALIVALARASESCTNTLE